MALMVEAASPLGNAGSNHHGQNLQLMPPASEGKVQLMNDSIHPKYSTPAGSIRASTHPERLGFPCSFFMPKMLPSCLHPHPALPTINRG